MPARPLGEAPPLRGDGEVPREEARARAPRAAGPATAAAG